MSQLRLAVPSIVILVGLAPFTHAQTVKDPGVRPGQAIASPLPGLTASELAFFQKGLDSFQEADDVSRGLGPTYNLDSCSGCHAQPAIGGSSPAVNPQLASASANGARNQVPSFITLNGPIREARFVRNPDGSADGGVHGLFTIAGRADAPGCVLAQPDFAGALNANNVRFRIPTPVFGAGLIESLTDEAILANLTTNAGQKAFLGIGGRVNRNGNDGTITRFGWKAQNKSLLLFAGEAYNVEIGVTNDLFPNKRSAVAGCQFTGLPDDSTHMNEPLPTNAMSDITMFTIFMRYLNAPTPATSNPSIQHGAQLFTSVGCAACHTPSFTTGNAASAALSHKQFSPYSDLALHHMGPNLSDGITQGVAGGDEFRTAPLWGLGQRIFFLHDGRTSDLLDAIMEHTSAPQGGRAGQPGPPPGPQSEATAVVNNFNALPPASKQDLLNFLRSL